VGTDWGRDGPPVLVKDVPKLAIVGPRRGGGRLHVRTAFRWALDGAAGVVLESVVQGGQRYTTAAAVARFFAAVTAARARGPAPGAARPAKPAADPAAVEGELDRLGF